MLGGTHYERSARDFYPSPPRTTNAFVSVVEDDLEAMQFWEPFAGNGAIYNIIAPLCRQAGATDIFRYDGFEVNGLIDFFSIYPDGEKFEIALAEWERHIDKHTGENGEYVPTWTKADREKAEEDPTYVPQAPPRPRPFQDVVDLLGFRPDCIITNPPYGKDAERAVRKALELMEAESGYVAFLMRHEWDAAKTRADVIDHPAFASKITLRFRPVWIEPVPGEKSSSPRFSYSWYVWDWAKAATAPHVKPELHYAG